MAFWPRGGGPHMAQEFKRTRAAFRARGLHVLPVSPALLVKSVRWSEELSIAMESKGFAAQALRSEYAPEHARGQDWVFLVVCCTVIPLIAVFL